MLRISTRGQYALLIMADLADSDSEKYISLKQLSQKHNLSSKYLEQILIQLSKAGLVSGLRGSNGGYKLSRKSESYSAGEILRALEGNLSPCENSEQNLKVVGNATFWLNFEKAINDYVDSVTLDSLAQANHISDGDDYCI